MDHLMNLELSEVFGGYYARIPLKKKAEIIKGNALQPQLFDWKIYLEQKQNSKFWFLNYSAAFTKKP